MSIIDKYNLTLSIFLRNPVICDKKRHKTFKVSRYDHDDISHNILPKLPKLLVDVAPLGQTGAGKSFSMVGYGPNKGIVPITCDELFKIIEGSTTDTKYQVTFSLYSSFVFLIFES